MTPLRKCRAAERVQARARDVRICAGGSKLLLTILAVSLCLGMPAAAQRLGITKGFKVLGENFDPPHDTQPRYVLEGATAQGVEDGSQLLTGVNLQTFNESGQKELLVQAPQCLYDRTNRSVSSPGSLRVQTGDGKFMIEGEGFLWRQTNSSLAISNHVHTTISADMLDTGIAPAGKAPTEKRGPVEIFSDAFAYSRDTGLCLYRGNVRVSGTNQMGMLSQLLLIKLPVPVPSAEARAQVPRGLEGIRAEQEVVLDYGGVHATGQLAVYSSQTGLLRLTGEPAWRADQRQGRADELIVDRTNKVFRAERNGWFRSPAQGVAVAGLLTQTNAPRSSPSTNHFVEIKAGSYEFRTNWAVFEGDVELREFVDEKVRGTITSGLLSASFLRSNQLETLTARTNVLIKDGTNWLSCGLAVLTGSNGLLHATESAAWGAGTRTGKGDSIRIDTRSKEMLVRGNAMLELPAGDLAQALPLQPGVTNAAALPTTNSIAKIFCEEYTLADERANFRGGVYATHPRMNWTCESLALELPHQVPRRQTLLADSGVKFQLSGNKGEQVEGTADKAIYVYGLERGVTNDVLTLTGSPATLHTTNGIMRNDTIIYDRVRNIIRTPGNYSIAGTNKLANTNLLVLPKGKLTR